MVSTIDFDSALDESQFRDDSGEYFFSSNELKCKDFRTPLFLKDNFFLGALEAVCDA